MKTTIELPDALVKQVKLRALRDNVKLKDAVAELLRRGLEAEDTSRKLERAEIGTDPRTGRPIILGGHPARPGEEVTPEVISEVLLAQEIEWYATPR